MMGEIFRRAYGSVGLVLLLLAGAAGAQPVPVIQSASIDTLRRGRTTEVMLSGENLAPASQVIVSGAAGVEASVVRAPVTQPTTKPAEGKSLGVSVVVDADAPRGIRELRVVTPQGVTRPYTIFVDDLEPTAEREPNNWPREASRIGLPTVLIGKVEKEFDADHFTFAAKKGQRLIFDLQAFRSGSKLDASMTILDSGSRRVAHDEDTNGLDPFIDFAVPADGTYTLRVQDLQYKGGGDYGYRIRAGELPHVDSVFPLGWRRGGQVELRLFGKNLGGATKMSMALDASDYGSMRR